jgi:hypothetical protein
MKNKKKAAHPTELAGAPAVLLIRACISFMTMR